MAIPGGNMTRMKSIAALGCTALAAALAAYGCGSSSTIDNGAGGGSSGSGGKTGGSGGGVVIINTGGMTGSGGRIVGTGGTPGGAGGMNQPPQDAGAGMCAPFQMCTAAGSTCDGTCRAGGQNGTRTCMCGNNGRYNCGACVTPDAGTPPPPVDAGPRPDAGPACQGNTNTGRVCMVGMSLSPCARMLNNGTVQTCTCAEVPGQDAGTGPDAAAPIARYTCM